MNLGHKRKYLAKTGNIKRIFIDFRLIVNDNSYLCTVFEVSGTYPKNSTTTNIHYIYIMKKISTLFIFMAAAMTAGAQQLPNVGFEGKWVDNYPWNSISNLELSMRAAAGRMNPAILDSLTYGIQPEGWIVSNVAGVVQKLDAENGGGWAALGATLVGTRVEGKDGGYAMCLTNNPNPFMATQVVPAYLTLGTTWATNTLKGFFQPADKDGGTFGGMDFNCRPDALTFDYKVVLAPDAEGDAKYTVLVYSWKGTWTQADVPANNSMSDETVKVTMTDRDRNILGIETAQGGAVTKTDDAELISKKLEYFSPEANSTDWETYVLPIEYLSDATPEKINVAIAATDYFDSDNIRKGDSIIVDNIKFVYYSRLASLSVNGTPVDDFDSDKFEYTVDAACPDSEDAITSTLLSADKANVAIAIDKAAATATVTVSSANGADLDGKDSHVYTLRFKADAPADDAEKVNGELSIFMFGDYIAEHQPATINIVKTGDNKCTITLPDFKLALSPEDEPTSLGDIVVPDVTIGTEGNISTYTGTVKGLSLLKGAIVCDVDLNGTIDAAGKATFKIDVKWGDVDIAVTFNGQTAGIDEVGVDNNAPVEYFNLNGMSIDEKNLTPGLYIRRQGNNVQKVLVK